MAPVDAMRRSRDGDLAARRILVTGGNGFVGTHLCERLLDEGAHVAVLARTPGLLAGRASKASLAFLQCDLADSERAVDAIARFAPDVLVHLASQPDQREDAAQAENAVRCNVLGTINALEGLRRAGGSMFVYGDSTKVYGNGGVPYRESAPTMPTSSYAIGKLAGWQFCELYARLHGLAVCALRPTILYGPRQRYNLFTFVAESVHRGQREIRLDGGHQTRDPLFIDDAIDAYVATIRAGAAVAGRKINIGGGREYTIADIARLVVELVGGDQRVVCVPGNERPTEIQRSWCDNVEARELIGWQPRTSLAAGLRRTLTTLKAGAACLVT